MTTKNTEGDDKKRSSFNESNNTIFEDVIPLDDTKEVRFSLVENKRSGIMRMNIREFTHTERYDGPTRNGMLLKVTTPEDVKRLGDEFAKFFTKVSEHL